MTKIYPLSAAMVSLQSVTGKAQAIVLTLILNFIHIVLDLAFSVNSMFISFGRSWCLPEKISLGDISSSCARLNKKPVHVVFCATTDHISFPDLAKLTCWSIGAGIRQISLYDPKGIVKRNQGQILCELRNYYNETFTNEQSRNMLGDVRWHNHISGDLAKNGNGSSNDNITHISLLSLEDGKPDIVKAAQSLAEGVAKGSVHLSEINEVKLESYLSSNHGLPDPDLLVRLGPTESNMGFLPWQTRLTEFHHLGVHKNVRFSDFFNVLSRYSRCQQRFGK